MIFHMIYFVYYKNLPLYEHGVYEYVKSIRILYHVQFQPSATKTGRMASSWGITLGLFVSVIYKQKYLGDYQRTSID